MFCTLGMSVGCVLYVQGHPNVPKILFSVTFLGAFAKLQGKRVLASSCLSVHMEQLFSHWTDFHEI